MDRDCWPVFTKDVLSDVIHGVLRSWVAGFVELRQRVGDGLFQAVEDKLVGQNDPCYLTAVLV